MRKMIYFQFMTAFTALAMWIANLGAGAASTLHVYEPDFPVELNDET